MDDASPRSRRSPLAGAVLVGGFGLVLYVFSVGPVIALPSLGVFGDWDETIILCYLPLIWLHEAVPASRLPIEAWIEFWESLL